jgi:hypothetical protein
MLKLKTNIQKLNGSIQHRNDSLDKFRINLPNFLKILNKCYTKVIYFLVTFLIILLFIKYSLF